MKVAVTIWGERVSPLFDASRRLLIVEIENACIKERTHMIFDPERPSDLARSMAALGVKVLICGAVSQVPAKIIVAGGITLIPFITGEVNNVIAAYAKGDPIASAFAMPGCRGSGSS
jgi:predicted Fe-Mo cluster-binding NifX family protein